MSHDWLLCLLFSFPLAMAFPPLRFGFLAYWAITPLLLLLENKSAGQALRWGYIAGFLLTLATVYWSGWINLLSNLSAIFLQPVFYAFFAAALVPVRKWQPTGYLALVPVLWCCMEYLQSVFAAGFPALKLAYTQGYYLNIIQYVPDPGVYVVSMWVVSLNVILLALWRRRGNRRHILALCTLLLVFCVMPYAYSRLMMRKADRIQENVIQVWRL